MRSTIRYVVASLIGLLWLGSATQAAEPAATIVFVMGQAQVERQGALISAKAGDRILESDRLVTARSSHLHIRTQDGSTIAIRPESSLMLGAYRFGQASQDDTVIRWELTKGVVRVVSGEQLERRKDRFRLNTPVAAIGIRGTDFSVYADPQVTRVSVLLGEIVMAPLGGSCQREAVGACSGVSALSLTANERQSMLILERGEGRPRVAPIDATAPDRLSPPLEGRTVSTAPAAAEPKVTADVQAKVAERVAQVIEATANTLVPALPQPDPIRVQWGRWKPIGQLGQQVSILAKKQEGSHLFSNDTHTLYRLPEDQPLLPALGNVVFKLGDAEAWFLNAGLAAPATVSGGALSVDFARRTFLFNMNVAADSKSWDLKAAGDLTARGLLVSDWRTSGTNTTVRGALAGIDATQAATLFNRTISPNQQISGAAGWSR